MTICLSMIVKNEAHTITRCLESVKPFIDYWVIADNGSTDNTEQVIKECLKDIPGEFIKTTWKDFSSNRNEALGLARNKSDYILFIDADDYLEANKDSFKNLTNKAYYIPFKHGTITYSRIQLIHNNLPCRYYGVLHEHLGLDIYVDIGVIDGKIHYGANGARWKDPLKYQKDAEVFEEALKDDPNNSRNVFYCAQSYKDAGNFEKAYEFYIKRAAMGGWEEECCIALLEAGKLAEKLNQDNIEDLYIKSFNVCPTRLEPLVYLSAYFRKYENFNKAYLYAKMGINLKMYNGLFMENACYDWKVVDELAIASYYIGKKEESLELHKRLLNLVPESELPRVTNNLQFFTA